MTWIGYIKQRKKEKAECCKIIIVTKNSYTIK